MNATSDIHKKPLEQIYRALSDRMRLRILLLLEDGELCVGDLVKALQAPQAKVSQHLGYLQRAGLVSVRRQGLWRLYQANGNCTPAVQQVLTALYASRADLPEASLDQQHLRELQAAGGCCPHLSYPSPSRGCRR